MRVIGGELDRTIENILYFSLDARTLPAGLGLSLLKMYHTFVWARHLVGVRTRQLCGSEIPPAKPRFAAPVWKGSDDRQVIPDRSLWAGRSANFYVEEDRAKNFNLLQKEEQIPEQCHARDNRFY